MHEIEVVGGLLWKQEVSLIGCGAAAEGKDEAITEDVQVSEIRGLEGGGSGAGDWVSEHILTLLLGAWEEVLVSNRWAKLCNLGGF